MTGAKVFEKLCQISRPGAMPLAVALTLALAATAAHALSVDQVIKLKKAGVSDATIQQMIRTEMKVGGSGGNGRYVVEVSEGKDLIVYRSSSPAGVVDYPWGEDQGLAPARLGPVATVLAAEDSRPRGGKAPAGFGPYTLHLSSFKSAERAQTQAKALAAKGVDARVVKVDLGDKGVWNRVVVGSFPARGTAQAQGAKLEAAGSIGSFRVIPRGGAR